MITAFGIKLAFKLDKWQEDVLAAEGNICLCSGRQVGKTEIVAIKSGEFAANNDNKKILVISITEPQADNMLQKIYLFLCENYPEKIGKGKDKPTNHKIILTNGSMIISKAIGKYGLGTLGLTIDVIVVDEGAYLSKYIWASLTPMLLTTGGVIWILSTPNAKEGFFYNAYTDPSMNFKTFHVTSEEVAKGRPEPKRSIMINHLKREKARMTKLQYAQQYLAQFLEEMSQMFPDDLIKRCQNVVRDNSKAINPADIFYLGVDVARMGGDEITFEILEKRKNKLIQRENIVKTYQLTTETVNQTLDLDTEYNFNKIYIDDGGLGVAVFDPLLDNEQTKYKVIAINNATRSLDRDNQKTKKLLKEDLYFNLKRLMELGQIELLKDQDIFTSLKSIVYENDAQQTRIYGRYAHIAEGLIRAAWSIKDRKLNLFYERQ